MFITDRFNLPSTRVLTDEGFLTVPAYIAKPGIQIYRGIELGLSDSPDAFIRVYRPPAEVFKEDSMRSFSNKPLTNNHPSFLLTAETASEFSVGHAGEKVFRDNGFVKTTLHIIDAKAINDIEEGKVELSNGYLADVEFVSGLSPEGEEYDALQSNIRGNHIALVEKGRAGSGVRVFDYSIPTQTEDLLMPTKVMLDGVDYEVSEQAAQAIKKLSTQLSASLTDNATLIADNEVKMATLMAAKEVLQTKVSEAEAKILDAAAIDVLVNDRLLIMDAARKIAPDIDLTGKSADEIKAAVVTAKVKNLTNDSAAYIQAHFDILTQGLKDKNPLTDALLAQTEVSDSDAEVSDSDKARTKFRTETREAWKKPV